MCVCLADSAIRMRMDLATSDFSQPNKQYCDFSQTQGSLFEYTFAFSFDTVKATCRHDSLTRRRR